MLLEVKDLNISLASGKCVAEHISFQLDQGEMLSIVGSSGAGKTTICKAIMGLLGNTYRADGEILFQGEDLLDLPERKRQTIYGKEICLIMQNPMTAFNPSIRVGRQMEKTYLLHHGKTPRQEMQRLFATILQKLGLEDTQRILNSYPFTLSGGMLQRLMIAAALMCQPALLVADEATTAIDACNRIGLMRELKSFCKDGMSVLFVTHDLRSASVSDRILVMDRGQIVEQGKTEQILNTPQRGLYKISVERLPAGKEGDVLIELKEVSCSFSDGFGGKGLFTAVSPLNAHFSDGGRYAIVGESGSGKTTLARMIAGLQRPSGGSVFVDGAPVYGRKRAGKEHFRKVQIIQQNSASALDPKIPVGKSIEEPLHCFFHMEKEKRRERCRNLMELCNLSRDYYTRLPSELSGGEQKRVAIARALAVEPQCLIFDEATNGFDLPLRKKIIDEIIDLQQQLGFTLIFITHDMELAVVVADEIFVMRNSNLVERAAFSGDYSVFHDPYSRMLLEASGLVDTSTEWNDKTKERIDLK